MRKGGKHIEVSGFYISIREHLLPDGEDLVSKPYTRELDGWLWRQIDLSLGYSSFDLSLETLWGTTTIPGILKIPGCPVGPYIKFPWQKLSSNYDLLG